MSASMAEHAPRRVIGNPPPMQVQRDAVDDRYRDLRRPRKLKFYVNGDRYFRGKKIFVTPNRYYNFNDLLNDLTGKLPSNLNLPYGVRQVFTPNSGRRIFDVEDLQEGETYVCAGFEGFKMIKYGRAELEPWSMARPAQHISPEGEGEAPTNYRYRGYQNNAFHPGRYFRTNQSYQQRRWPGTFGQQRGGYAATGATQPGAQSENAPGKPKVVTIVRSGARPRQNVKILLNRRSVQSYEQLVSDISEAFGPRYRLHKVRKLVSVRGKEVQGVSDFFREDDCFIALGVGENGVTDSEVADIIDELYPDQHQARSLLKDWERNQRRKRKGTSPTGQSVKSSQLDAPPGGAGKGHLPSDIPDKRDSGFDSSDASTNRSEPTDRAGATTYRPRRKVGKDKEDKENQSLEGSPPPHGYALMRKLEKERMKQAEVERERAKRRQQKMIDAEKRAVDEERRKRGLIPLKNIDNPFKKNDDAAKEKEKEEARKRKEEEKRKKEEEMAEAARKEKEERDAAEAAARERMAKARREEQEKLEKEKADREKQENERREREQRKKAEREEKRKADKAAKEKKLEEEANAKQALAVEAKASEKPEPKPAAQEEPKAQPPPDKPTPAVEPTKEVAADVTDGNNNKQQPSKEKRKPPPEKEDKTLRKRAKTKIVRRTKEERQVDSDDYILARYELGRKLGDGNFAIVRQSRKKETGQEFAIKVIDKAKLKGKEHMVENEIDIMKDCNHQNIVRLYEEYETLDRLYLVMELVKGGDLFDAITQSVKFGEMESSFMVKDLCSALFYMHSRSIVHRDLKPENLLVHRNKDGSITLKLADFGLAMEVKELIYTVCGTPTYVAPEILTEIGYGLEVDMWAVGVITYILLCGFPPFRSPDRNQTELFEFIKAGEYEFLSPYWDNTSKSAKDLISRLLVVDRKKRYTSVDVLSHRFVVCKGQTDMLPEGSLTVDMACKDVRSDLESQAKQNYQSYQKLKEKKRRERDKGEEE